MAWCDAHLHLSECSSQPVFDEDYLCVSSFHSIGQYGDGEPSPSCVPPFANAHPPRFAAVDSGVPCTTVLKSFGIHPQMLAHNLYGEELKPYLTELASSKKIAAIGECGFDFFTEEYKKTENWQTEVFEFQLNLALQNNLPVILHLRKALHKVFEYKAELRKLPAVIFHSFPGTVIDVQSILRHGINGYFSFGKPVINGKKTSIECVKSLPIERLLFETDAPYQTLKDEKTTPPEDIIKVYRRCCELRNVDMDFLKAEILKNFKAAYGL